jgi:uncharacterized Ntn-hydrolase superfamily protein
MQLATYSIVAKNNRTKEFGVASATAAPCVGAFLPFAEEAVGAIATQAWVNVNIGFVGLELMRSGFSVKTAIETVLADDGGRARRQVIGIDHSSVHGYTGQHCTDPKGHMLGGDFAVAGNILADVGVLDEMASAFKKAKGELGNRMICALEAGEAAGGDHRGKMSSVLLVASPTPKLNHNIRVDISQDPVNELRALHSRLERMQEELGDDDGGEVLRRKVRRVAD